MSDALLTLTADAGLTAALARALATELRAGDTVLLDGPVGAGKSHFARALIRARLDDPCHEVPSPTFTLVQTYEGDPAIWHADLYRLTDPAEVDELGLTDALPDSIALIEWPDRMGQVADALTIRIQPVADDPDLRRISIHGDGPRGQMARRAAQRADFVHRAGWGAARVARLAGDASARRYFRLTQEGGATSVLMDSDATTLAPYLAMTGWLRARDFAAPAVLAADPGAGLALIEDLGDAQIAGIVAADPDRAGPLYLRIAGLLARLAACPPAPGIAALDGARMADQVGLFAQYYPPAAGAEADARAAADEIAPVIAGLYRVLCADIAPVTSLRDFHAENIILTPDDRLGLIDFQDAVAAHPGYDLVSVLDDPRRALPDGVAEGARAHFLALTGLEPDRFAAASALLSAQRNLRIMGIYTRLCTDFGKPRYLGFMPRTWALIESAVAHPALAPLAGLVARIPAPTPGIIERIAATCRR
ncbi:MAG: tRNA (adenosine(37)-N6)-threonylcarbamoyltransferase complex ATPase subunit type 1 TsaE [Paracoccus sp. (in: a-proteobacteria)]|nr:tRNA (adenosine(37)-N6)-threonylcarbamoyltransferase complex ATPase subunit type 1 TsaE [Paracoccus sp. (in: a-proteobacteria)]